MEKIFERMADLVPQDSISTEARLLDAARSVMRDMASADQSPNIRALPPDPNTVNRAIPDPSDFRQLAEMVITEAKKMRFPPPQVLPCANAQPSEYKACARPGTRACSECRLVSYCSKDCQKEHWKRHKRDCKNAMRSCIWKPIWECEGRPPSFLTESSDNSPAEEFWSRRKEEEFSVGMSLWGNTPAMDIINLDMNEKEETKDFSLAFSASGDLRHVLSTVNGLPMTYSGRLSVLVNDINALIACRNVVVLLILTTIEDEALAVDMAIHFWYSIFMPSEYKFRLSVLLANVMMNMHADSNGNVVLPLSPDSALSFCLPGRSTTQLFTHFIADTFTVGDVQQEYARVRAAPCRADFRDRMYLGLRPSHRVAFDQYRRFGLVLPFGAMNAHFNSPNQSLFSPGGKWMQTDYADPLEGWNIDAVLAAGKACGALPEDIYGCLYFFLSQELRQSFQRIRAFSGKISFTVTAFEAGHDLPVIIRDDDLSALGVPASTVFDRIAVSNILDVNYVGVRQVLMGWSPFLAKTPHAAIVGYFMNWFVHQPGGQWSTAGRNIGKGVVHKLWKKRTPSSKPIPKPESLASAMNFMFSETTDAEALYDGSAAFDVFLMNQGLEEVLRETGLELRARHTIVAHRILAPLEGKPSDLPVFPDDDSWYYNTKLTSFTWSERYVEFTRRV